MVVADALTGQDAEGLDQSGRQGVVLNEQRQPVKGSEPREPGEEGQYHHHRGDVVNAAVRAALSCPCRARNSPETALRATSLRLATRSSAAPFTCAVVRGREAVHSVVNHRRIDGMQEGRGSNPLSSTPGQRPNPASTNPESGASGSRSAASGCATARCCPLGLRDARISLRRRAIRWLALILGLERLSPALGLLHPSLLLKQRHIRLQPALGLLHPSLPLKQGRKAPGGVLMAGLCGLP
jgi:hypothetical protein